MADQYPTVGLGVDLADIAAGQRKLKELRQEYTAVSDAAGKTGKAATDSAKTTKEAATAAAKADKDRADAAKRAAQDEIKARQNATKAAQNALKERILQVRLAVTAQQGAANQIIASLRGEEIADRSRANSAKVNAEIRARTMVASSTVASKAATTAAQVQTQAAHQAAAAQKTAASIAAQAAKTAAQVQTEAYRQAAIAQRAASQQTIAQLNAQIAAQRLATATAQAAAAAARGAGGGGGGGGGGGFFGGGGGSGGPFLGGINKIRDALHGLRILLFDVRAAIGVFLGAMVVRPLVEMADAFVALHARIAFFAEKATDVPLLMEQVYRTAQDARAPLSAIATLYTRLAPLAAQLGKSQRQMLDITGTVAKGFTIGGATAAESTASAQQLAQALASNRLGGDELRSLAENAPILMATIAKQLNMNTGEFIKWAHSGKANAAVIVDALEKSKDKIDAMFKAFPMTIGQASTVVGNAFKYMIGQVNEATKASQAIATAMAGVARFFEDPRTIEAVAQALTAVGKALHFVGEAIGFVASMAPAIAFLVGGATVVRLGAWVVGLAAVRKAMIGFAATSALVGPWRAAWIAGTSTVATGATRFVGLMKGAIAFLGGPWVIALALAAAAVTVIWNTLKAGDKAVKDLQKNMANAGTAVQGAIAWADAYGQSSDELTKILGRLTGTQDSSTSSMSKAEVQAKANAEIQRVMAMAALADAEATLRSAEAKARHAASMKRFFATVVDGLAMMARLGPEVMGFLGLLLGGVPGQVAGQTFGNSSVLHAAAEGLRQDAADLDAAAGQYRDGVSALKDAQKALASMKGKAVITQSGAAGPAAPGKPEDPKGMFGAINAIEKLKAEAKGLRSQLDAIDTNPMSDVAARIKAAGDEAAAQRTAGKGAQFAEMARVAAQNKEALSIALDMAKGIAAETREHELNAQATRAQADAQAKASGIMVDYYRAGTNGLDGYQAALDAANDNLLQAKLLQNDVNIATKYGAANVNDIAETWAAYSPVLDEVGQKLEDMAKADLKAANSADTAADATDRQAAATERLKDALSAAAAIKFADQKTAYYAGQGGDVRDASDRIDAKAAVLFEEALQRGEPITFNIARNLAKASAMIDKAADDTQRLNIELQDAMRNSFIENGNLDLVGFRKSIQKALRKALYDEYLAKPINVVIKAVVDYETKALKKVEEGLGEQWKKLRDGPVGDKLESAWRGLTAKIPASIKDGFTKLVGKAGQVIGQASPYMAVGNAASHALGIEGSKDHPILQQVANLGGAVVGMMLGGPIGAVIGTIATNLLGGLMDKKLRPNSMATIGMVNGQFAVTGQTTTDEPTGELAKQIDDLAKSIAQGLNTTAAAFGVNVSKLSNYLTTVGYVSGDRDFFGLGGKGFYGGDVKPGSSDYGSLYANALRRGTDFSKIEDPQELATEIMRQMLLDAAAAGALDLSEAERKLIEAADNLDEAAAIIKNARGLAGDLSLKLLGYTDPKNAALIALRQQQVDRRNQVASLYASGLVAPGSLDATLSGLETAEIRDTLNQFASAVDGATASLEQMQDAQKQIADFARGLLSGPLSPLSPEAKLGQDQSVFAQLLAAAQGGSYDALQKLPDAAQSYLEDAQSFFGSSEQYAAIFQQVQDALSGIATQDFADPIEAAVEQANADLQAAIAAGSVNVVDAIAALSQQVAKLGEAVVNTNAQGLDKVAASTERAANVDALVNGGIAA